MIACMLIEEGLSLVKYARASHVCCCSLFPFFFLCLQILQPAFTDLWIHHLYTNFQRPLSCSTRSHPFFSIQQNAKTNKQSNSYCRNSNQRRMTSTTGMIPALVTRLIGRISRTTDISRITYKIFRRSFIRHILHNRSPNMIVIVSVIRRASLNSNFSSRQVRIPSRITAENSVHTEKVRPEEDISRSSMFKGLIHHRDIIGQRFLKVDICGRGDEGIKLVVDAVFGG